ncbi:uncharacterized protein LOC107981635 [Nasonia vitripennis]|uniref:Uncharacterized protein n=1 Tax=Nasonia vitripennis TaxID=7425 RepID=A0A7M7ISJ2_NASVI|nr:uncharacterized protein LOC107981635 [Nasonia vitripennis]
MASFFTTNEEMLQFEDRDATTSMIGYVDFITAPTPSGKENTPLLKFTLTNGSKRIDILIWDDDNDLINKYQKDICINRIININGGHCRATKSTKFHQDNNLVPFEILVKENTTIHFLGYHTLKSSATEQVQKVSFDTIHNIEGLVEISGYIRTPFSLIYNRTGLMSYGLSAITDGQKKLTVQVKQFLQSKLELGDSVTVTGTVKGQDSLVNFL